MSRRVSAVLTILIGLAAVAADARAAGDPAAAQLPVPAGASVIEFGGEADEVHSGGAGRYYVAHVKDTDKLTVVDAVAGKVVKQIPAHGAFRFAVSREKLIIVLNDTRVAQRWDLKTLKREKSVLLQDDKPVQLLSLGSAGTGPLALWAGGKVQFWDLGTLKPLKVRGDGIDQPANVRLWPSADGLTFAAWGWSTVPYVVVRLSNVTKASADASVVQTPDGEDYNESWAMPSADGSLLVRHGGRLYTGDMAPLDPGPLKDAVVLPTEDPRFLLALRRTDQYKSEGNTISVVAANDRRVLYTVKDVPPVTGGDIPSIRGRLGPEPRAHYLPEQNLLVTLPDDNTRVVVQPFDLTAALKATEADYLFVISKPPTRVKPGANYTYQIETLSGAGGVTYKLDEAPKGMTVSDTGLLKWRAPGGAPADGGKVGVILTIADSSEQEVMHTIELTVTKAAGPGVPDGKQPPTDPSAPPARPPIEKVSAPALKGVWAARPKIDEKKLRALLTAQGLASRRGEAVAAKLRKAVAGLKVTYAFNDDGTAVTRYGKTQSPGSGGWTYEVLEAAGSATRVRLTPDGGGAAQDVELTFVGRDRFRVNVLPGADLPVRTPIMFERSREPAPQVAAATPARPPKTGGAEPPAGEAAEPAGDAELTRLGERLAAALGEVLENELPHDPLMESLSSDVRLIKAERTAGGGGRITLGTVVIRQAPAGEPPADDHSETVIDLRLVAGKWSCVKAVRRPLAFGADARDAVDVTHDMRRQVDAAQGVAVVKAQPLGPGDQPVDGPPGDDLMVLAARLARDVEAGVRRDARAFPEFTSATVRVGEVERTKNGAHIVLGITHDFVFNGDGAGRPSEFVTGRTSVDITLRAAAGGGWTCARAISRLDSASGRGGPLTLQPGPPKDVTADVQEWLDHAAAPAKPGKPKDPVIKTGGFTAVPARSAA